LLTMGMNLQKYHNIDPCTLKSALIELERLSVPILSLGLIY
jgi:hypothetical protein